VLILGMSLETTHGRLRPPEHIGVDIECYVSVVVALHAVICSGSLDGA